MRGINLDQLRTFAEVVACGSFSAVAQRMNLSQPAISLQVRQLETRLGVRLIERVGRRMTPTAAGTALLAHARQIDAAVGSALDEMARFATGAVGRIRLGTGATACIYLLPPALGALRRRFPALEITVSTGNTADIVAAVQDNRIDIGLVTMPAAGRMLEVTPLLDDEFVAIAAAERGLPTRVTAAALAKRSVLLYEPGGNTRRLVDDWFARRAVDLQPVMALGSVEAIKELVGVGLGCAVLPRLAVRPEADRAQLTVRSLCPKLHRKLAMVVRLDKPRTPGLREMMRALEALAPGALAAPAPEANLTGE